MFLQSSTTQFSSKIEKRKSALVSSDASASTTPSQMLSRIRATGSFLVQACTSPNASLSTMAWTSTDTLHRRLLTKSRPAEQMQSTHSKYVTHFTTDTSFCLKILVSSSSNRDIKTQFSCYILLVDGARTTMYHLDLVFTNTKL